MFRSLSRRTFLRGALGGTIATVALPTLEAMVGRGNAYSGTSPVARRFVGFHFGNGIDAARWVPTATGPGYALSDQLAPLVDVRDDCRVISGLDVHYQSELPHHNGTVGMWSAFPYIDLGHPHTKFGGPSIDQIVAKALSGQTTLPSLQLAVSKRTINDQGPTLLTISHASSDQPILPEQSPRALFARLFGLPPPGDPSRPSRLDVLSAVAEDARTLKARVGRKDRERIDQHLESISQLQTRIDAQPAACTAPAEPTQANVDVEGLEPMVEVARLMTDLLVYALACDLTRVATFMLTPPQALSVYHFLGQTNENHTMSHEVETYRAELHADVLWNMEQFAYLLGRMKGTPDGAATLLDNSVVLLGSDCSNPQAHSITNMPVIVAGGGGGALRRPGEHVAATGQSVSDVLLACMQAVAPGITSVGTDTMRSETPFEPILA